MIISSWPSDLLRTVHCLHEYTYVKNFAGIHPVHHECMSTLRTIALGVLQFNVSSNAEYNMDRAESVRNTVSVEPI